MNGRQQDTPATPRDAGMTREERLAARLRENLHRRKAQARAMQRTDSAPTDSDQPDDAGANLANSNPALPKSAPKS